MNRPRRSVAAAAAAFTAILFNSPARAAAPVVDYLYPAGGQQGGTVAVTAGGKFERWPVKVWADHPGIKAEPAAEKGKLNVTIDKAVPAGPHLLRLYDAEGASVPRVFVVGTLLEATEAEPNDEAARAQPLDATPVTVNGRLEKSGDVDSYAVKLEAGQWLSAALKGRRLGAPMDPLLHLSDPAGNELAFTHDGLGLDPLLVYRAEKAGTYVVRVSAFKYPPAADVKLTGEPADVYRLTLSTAPPVRYAMPAGVRRGTKATVRLFGWDGEEVATREVDATGAGAADASKDSALAEESVELAVGGAEGALSIAVGDGPDLAEADWGGASQAAGGEAPAAAGPATAGAAPASPAAPAPPAPPAAVTGRIGRPGEEDVYRFAAKKGEKITLSVTAAALACPMDAVVRVEDEAGKVLVTNDDGRGGAAGDARLDWAAPADGTFRAVVSDLFSNGGQEYVYRLSLRRPSQSVVATADADEYRVAAGKTAAISVNVARPEGFTGPLVAVATMLPAGVSATSAEVPEKGGAVTITLSAAADAKAAAGPIRVVVAGADPARPSAWVAAASLRKEAGQELVGRTQSVWLTVLPGK